MHNHAFNGLPLGFLDSFKVKCKAEWVRVDGFIRAVLQNHFKYLFPINMDNGSNFVFA